MGGYLDSETAPEPVLTREDISNFFAVPIELERVYIYIYLARCWQPRSKYLPFPAYVVWLPHLLGHIPLHLHILSDSSVIRRWASSFKNS